MLNCGLLDGRLNKFHRAVKVSDNLLHFGVAFTPLGRKLLWCGLHIPASDRAVPEFVDNLFLIRSDTQLAVSMTGLSEILRHCWNQRRKYNFSPCPVSTYGFCATVKHHEDHILLRFHKRASR